MDEWKNNAHPDTHAMLGMDREATAVVAALANSFYTTNYRSNFTRFGASYRSLFCKPTKALADSLAIDREVLCLLAPYETLHARTLNVIQEILQSESPRLEETIALVMHRDPRGDSQLRNWGREQGITILPIYKEKHGALPTALALRQRFAHELYSSDPFQRTGPVSRDVDFFGRRDEAIALLRHLESGTIRSIFGIRKVGKTSLIGRLIDLSMKGGGPRIAMIDCSAAAFHKLDTAGALSALAKTCKMAAHRGYAHVTEAIKSSGHELSGTFDELWQTEAGKRPLVVIFDEVDYVTPESPASPQWAEQFNDFWREFRVLKQESERHGMTLGVLVSGVSSKYFRSEEVNGVENPVLHFVPEEYLTTFHPAAAAAMIRTIGRRAGLYFEEESAERIAIACGGFPFWIRIACSYINGQMEIDARPQRVDPEQVNRLIEQFIEVEGIDVARVALSNLRRYEPSLFADLERLLSGNMPLRESRLLVRLGIAEQTDGRGVVTSTLLRAALTEMMVDATATPLVQALQGSWSDDQWAEELSVINKRRNLLERDLRSFVRFSLKASGSKLHEAVIDSVPEHRRQHLRGLTGDALMSGLYWIELKSVIRRHWELFEQTLGDKARFSNTMDLLNDRPDAHAKPIDAADLALQRRELEWLERRISD